MYFNKIYADCLSNTEGLSALLLLTHVAKSSSAKRRSMKNGLKLYIEHGFPTQSYISSPNWLKEYHLGKKWPRLIGLPPTARHYGILMMINDHDIESKRLLTMLICVTVDFLAK